MYECGVFLFLLIPAIYMPYAVSVMVGFDLYIDAMN